MIDLVTRRRALVAALGLGGAALAGAMASSRGQSGTKRLITRTGWALGSSVSLSVASLSPAIAQRGLDAAFAELETVEQVMSLYRPASQICRLNRTGELRDPHPYLLAVLRQAESTSRQTGGAFDITVQPLWELYSSVKTAGRLPTTDEIAAAKAKIGWWGVDSRSDDVVRLARPGMAITLNGVAQGFAADRALAALREHGAEQALVNAGEIASRGARPDRQPWRVGIQHPREREAYVSLAGLAGRSLSTSGDYETTFTADFARNHIFDPRTGTSPPELASVSIVAPTALEADALSTAAMVLGMDQTLSLVARSPGVDALFVTKAGRVVATPGFPEISPAPSGRGSG